MIAAVLRIIYYAIAYAVAVVATLMVIAILIGGIVKDARGHEWYSAACCKGTDEDGDCEPIDGARVRLGADGYRVDGAENAIAELLAKPSPDGRYHACISDTGYLRCIYVPRVASDESAGIRSSGGGW